MASCLTLSPSQLNMPSNKQKRSPDSDYLKSVKRRKHTGTMFTSLSTPSVDSSTIINANTPKSSPFDIPETNNYNQIQANEQLHKRIKEEASRLVKRKQLPCQQQLTAEDSLLVSSSSSSPSSSSVALFTLKQVNQICEKLCKEREEVLKEKYELILSLKLNEQYDTFVRFTHDQIQKKFEREQFSYVS